MSVVRRPFCNRERMSSAKALALTVPGPSISWGVGCAGAAGILLPGLSSASTLVSTNVSRYDILSNPSSVPSHLMGSTAETGFSPG